MADTRSRRLTDKFKQQAVRFVRDEGNGVAAVARELDLVGSRASLVEHAEPHDGPGTYADRAPRIRTVRHRRLTKQRVLEQTRAWGLTNRRNRSLTSQAIGSLLRNHLYAGIVHLPEYRIRAKRCGDVKPLISEDLFYRVQRAAAEHDTESAHAPRFPTVWVRSLRVLWSSPFAGIRAHFDVLI